MTITQLEYIIALNTHRNFARAAKHCYVTQPTLSMQIKKLEESLQVVLFDRNKKPVLPTEIGKKIIAQAKTTLREANKIRALIREEKDEMSGELRIGIIPTLSPYLLPLFVNHFIDKYPGIQLVVEEMLTKQIIQKLKDDQLDVGLIVTPIKESSLLEIPAFYERFVVYTADKTPLWDKKTIDTTDLKLDDIWLLKEGHCLRSQILNICGEDAATPDRRLRFESGSLETLKRIVERQSGYTLLPELATLDLNEENERKIRQFNPPYPVREVSIVIHRSYIKRKMVSLLREEILAHIPNELKDADRGKVIKW